MECEARRVTQRIAQSYREREREREGPRRTDGEGDHLLLGVAGEVHLVDQVADGVNGALGHLRRRHGRP